MIAIAWSHAGQKHVDVPQTALRLVNRDTFTFTMHGGTLQCYCACRVPYDATHWVLALAPPILPSHTAWHAVPFRFPFQLPLYPEGDVVFVRVALLTDACADAEKLRPFYLSCVPPCPVGVVVPLTAEAWLESEPTWRQAIEAAGDTPAFLSAAFDNMWDCTITPGAVIADDDAFLSTDAIEDPDCDSDVIALHTALFAAAPIKLAGKHDAVDGSSAAGGLVRSDDACSVVVAEDACLDDDDEAAQIDIHTGLVATDAACMDDQDDELESIDGDTDDEEDDEDDDDDEEDDDDVTE